MSFLSAKNFDQKNPGGRPSETDVCRLLPAQKHQQTPLTIVYQVCTENATLISFCTKEHVDISCGKVDAARLFTDEDIDRVSAHVVEEVCVIGLEMEGGVGKIRIFHNSDGGQNIVGLTAFIWHLPQDGEQQLRAALFLVGYLFILGTVHLTLCTLPPWKRQQCGN